MPREKGNKDKKGHSSSEPQLPLDLSRRQVHYHFASDPESSPTSPRGQSQLRLQHSKQALIRDLSAQMAHKIRTDDHHVLLLEGREARQNQKMRRIEEEISRINKQNEQQLQDLERMERGVLKRMERAIKREREQEQGLLRQYEQAVAQCKKIQLTKQVKRIREQEDWAELQQQQRQLSLKARHQEEAQNKVIRHSSLDFLKKQPIEEKKEKKKGKQAVEQPADKGKKRKKNAQQLRQMGRNYLQHAKKIQAERLRANIKLLDVSRKSIDYLPQIKTILRMNVQDLSNPMQNTVQSLDPRRKRRVRIIRENNSPRD